MQEILDNMVLAVLVFIIGTYLAVEAVKWIARQYLVERLQKYAQLAAFAFGIVFCVGWKKSIFPQNDVAGYELFAQVLTGLFVGGAATGVYEFLKHYLPPFNKQSA